MATKIPLIILTRLSHSAPRSFWLSSYQRSLGIEQLLFILKIVFARKYSDQYFVLLGSKEA